MSKRILVVDDDVSFVRLVERILRSAGYEVLIATNGLSALKTVQDDKPDLVLLDIMLPGVDGFEICKRLRDNPDTAQVPVLIVSSKSRESDRSAALDVGANDFCGKPVKSKLSNSSDFNDFCGKPVKSEELLSLVKSLLRKKSPADEFGSARQSNHGFLADDIVEADNKRLDS